MNYINKLATVFGILIAFSCTTSPPIESQIFTPETEIITIHDTVYIELPLVETDENIKVLPGINVLVDQQFDILAGKKVGLITNQTGIDTSFNSTIDLMFNSDVFDLVALYSPEHGIRGNEDAGKILESYVDSVTGLPVFSLHGKNRKMSDEMLKGVDIVVYDIQDIGCRSYTFTSTMGLAMETCAKNGIPFVILDRPNPLGGIRVEGLAVEPGFESFVSQYSIPYVYGLTIGELANFLNEEFLLKDSLQVDLHVVKMEEWKREMSFEMTGLTWIPTSPHIPNQKTPLYYVSTGVMGELGVVSEGVGYTAPFHYIGAPWIDGDILSDTMNKLYEGAFFRPVVFKPYYGKYKDQYLNGVEILITDPGKIDLLSIQFTAIKILNDLYPGNNIFQMAEQPRLEMFDKVIGTDRIRKAYSTNTDLEQILNLLNEGVDEFRERSAKYYLYD